MRHNKYSLWFAATDVRAHIKTLHCTNHLFVSVYSHMIVSNCVVNLHEQQQNPTNCTISVGLVGSSDSALKRITFTTLMLRVQKKKKDYFTLSTFVKFQVKVTENSILFG